MRAQRLRWICKAIEYDMLTKGESIFLFNTIEDFTAGKLMSKSTEDKLESIFAEAQWREVETKTLYEIWSKKQQENKESVLQAQS